MGAIDTRTETIGTAIIDVAGLRYEGNPKVERARLLAAMILLRESATYGVVDSSGTITSGVVIGPEDGSSERVHIRLESSYHGDRYGYFHYLSLVTDSGIRIDSVNLDGYSQVARSAFLHAYVAAGLVTYPVAHELFQAGTLFYDSHADRGELGDVRRDQLLDRFIALAGGYTVDAALTENAGRAAEQAVAPLDTNQSKGEGEL